jgi:hypothetical protein
LYYSFFYLEAVWFVISISLDLLDFVARANFPI